MTVAGLCQDLQYHKQRCFGPRAQPLSHPLVEMIAALVSSRALEARPCVRVRAHVRHIDGKIAVNQATASTHTLASSQVDLKARAAAVATASQTSSVISIPAAEEVAAVDEEDDVCMFQAHARGALGQVTYL